MHEGLRNYRRSFIPVMGVAVACWAVVGCGGHHGSHSTPTATTGTPDNPTTGSTDVPTGTNGGFENGTGSTSGSETPVETPTSPGSVRVTIQWPAASRFVAPSAANFVRVTLFEGDGTTGQSLGVKVVKRPEGTDALTQTVEFPGVPVGAYLVRSEAYPDATPAGDSYEVSGNPLATGNSTVEVASGASSDLNVQTQSTLEAVRFTGVANNTTVFDLKVGRDGAVMPLRRGDDGVPALVLDQPVSVTVSPLSADGALVLVPTTGQSPFTVSVGDGFDVPGGEITGEGLLVAPDRTTLGATLTPKAALSETFFQAQYAEADGEASTFRIPVRIPAITRAQVVPVVRIPYVYGAYADFIQAKLSVSEGDWADAAHTTWNATGNPISADLTLERSRAPINLNGSWNLGDLIYRGKKFRPTVSVYLKATDGTPVLLATQAGDPFVPGSQLSFDASTLVYGLSFPTGGNSATFARDGQAHPIPSINATVNGQTYTFPSLLFRLSGGIGTINSISTDPFWNYTTPSDRKRTDQNDPVSLSFLTATGTLNVTISANAGGAQGDIH